MSEDYMISLRDVPHGDRMLKVMVDILMELRKLNTPQVKLNKPLDKK